MHPFDEEVGFTEDVLIGQSALCLIVPGTDGEELVVHREGAEDYVFLFESLDDAYDCASQALGVLGFVPEVGRAHIPSLNFRTARYKPAVGDPVDIALKPR